MRILLINREVGTGSVGKIVEDLYFGIKKAGHECVVAYGNKNKSKIPSKDLFKVCNWITIRVHIIISRLFDRSGFFGKRKTKKLIKLIKEYNPDIIHIHGIYGYWINIQTLLKYLATTNIKVVDTLHSCWDFTGHCCYFTKAKCDKWKTGCHNCPERKSYPKSIFFDNSKKNYIEKKDLFCNIKNLYLVSPSMWLTGLVKESFLSAFPISTINNGIDLEYFKKTNIPLDKYGVDINKPYILGVASRWDERKGLSDFVELSKYIGSNKIQIVIVGVSKKQIASLPSNIICITRTDNKTELASIYSAATILFNPTYEDNYPTVNLESIACGTPVVTYQTGGSPEVVEQTGFGKIIQHRDFSSLMDFFFGLRNNDKTIDEQTRRFFSKERMTDEYLCLYQEVFEK